MVVVSEWEWRDENRINNIILDDLYVSLGTLLEERGY